jgi:putative tryptophan/tyrosine transport system substrate-binding protein
MRRREFIGGLGGTAMTWPVAARSQQAKVPIIGFLSSASPTGWDNYLAAFREGLREHGFVEGSTIRIEYRWANGNLDRLSALAVDLVSLQVAAVVASGGPAPAIAGKAASSTIPIVFTGVANPVELGLVASLNLPASNLTGVSTQTTEVLPKKIELLSALVPKAEVFGLLVNPTNANIAEEARIANAAVVARGKSLILVEARSEEDFGPAFDALITQSCDALILATDVLFNNHRNTILALVDRRRIPAMYGWPEFPRAGGMASYGSDLAEQYRLAGIFIGRILKGERPQDLPVMQPTKFNFVINLKTMKALNIEAPANIVALADEVIE